MPSILGFTAGAAASDELYRLGVAAERVWKREAEALREVAERIWRAQLCAANLQDMAILYRGVELEVCGGCRG
jgi:hypothetical protein